MRIERLFKSLPILAVFAMFPLQAAAQDDGWERVDVFGGRASVEVPKSYKQSTGEVLDLFRDDASGRDYFYREGMREAWISAFNETRGSYTFAMSVIRNSRAHFSVLELRPDRGNDLYAYCSQGQDMAVYKKYGTYVTYHDRSRGTCFWGGIGGAAAWVLCKRIGENRICVEAKNYLEYYKARRWWRNAPATWRQAHKLARGHSSAEALRNRFWHMANGPVIERVLESFRYK